MREPDGGGDLNPENAGWRDDTASDGVGGYGDVEAGAGLAMRGVGEDTPDANRNTVAEFAAAGQGASPARGRNRTEWRCRNRRPTSAAAAHRVVVCGRRTVYADSLLEYARGRHMASRVDFIYELSPDDLPALFRLAHAFVYLPDAGIEASIVPVVEAMRAGVPMVLSDTQLNREAAGDAAAYVRPEAAGEVAAALENVLSDVNFRREMKARERRRAELFSEYAVARRLIDIYSSL
ncbi:MAG: glycosyltransferase [Alistipes finegoldii]